LNLSLETLGHELGVQARYLERIELGHIIPKPSMARLLAKALNEPIEPFLLWAKSKRGNTPHENPSLFYPRYPEARQALIELCIDPALARRLFIGSAIGPLEASLYGLLIDRMSQRMADMGFWGFFGPSEKRPQNPDGPLLLEAFFEMLSHPEGEIADYTKVFSELIVSWFYGPEPHRITVSYPDKSSTTYRVALIDKEGTVIPALESEDPFYAIYRMLTKKQRSDIAEISRVLLRDDKRIEIQAALEAITRWNNL